VTVLNLNGQPVRWKRPQDITRRVMWDKRDTSGRRVTGSIWTIAHLDNANDRALKVFKKPITVIQPPYNTGVPASAGTHDLDVCLDWYIPGVDWWRLQRFWRANGGWGWYRHAPLFSNHIHGGALPIPEGKVRSDDFMAMGLEVGIYVPGQLVDYYNHAFGLANQHTPGTDKSWFPKDIDARVFNLDDYRKRQLAA
jgi:hypothetical protein